MTWPRIAWALQRGAHTRFLGALHDLEGAQRSALARALRGAAGLTPAAAERAGLTWEELGRRVAPSSWEDHRPWIEELRSRRPAGLRFEPTSGSTAKRKWIPYPLAFRRSLDEAAAAWMHDAGCRYPGILRGRQYWSLSWQPQELRAAGHAGDDLELLTPARSLLYRRLMAVPGKVAALPSSEAALLATLVHLAAASDLSLLSAWSPTFLLRLVAALRERREAVAAVLDGAGWDAGQLPASAKPALPGWRAPRNRTAAVLLRSWSGGRTDELVEALWPRLALVSSWDSSTSRSYAQELWRTFPRAHFQGKGLWATEGVVTIPFQGGTPIAATSHAIELRCLATGAILPPWRVEEGQEVQPLLTTANGLARYALPDRCRVTGFMGTAPCLEFLGRMGGVDLVGEKLDAALAQQVLDVVGGELGCGPISLLALDGSGPEAPHYCLLAEPGPGAPAEASVAARAEELLGEIHHYRLARELGQLGPVQAMVRADALAEYHRRAGVDPGADGHVKIESVFRAASGRTSGSAG